MNSGVLKMSLASSRRDVFVVHNDTFSLSSAGSSREVSEGTGVVAEAVHLSRAPLQERERNRSAGPLSEKPKSVHVPLFRIRSVDDADNMRAQSIGHSSARPVLEEVAEFPKVILEVTDRSASFEEEFRTNEDEEDGDGDDGDDAENDGENDDADVFGCIEIPSRMQNSSNREKRCQSASIVRPTMEASRRGKAAENRNQVASARQDFAEVPKEARVSKPQVDRGLLMKQRDPYVLDAAVLPMQTARKKGKRSSSTPSNASALQKQAAPKQKLRAEYGPLLINGVCQVHILKRMIPPSPQHEMVVQSPEFLQSVGLKLSVRELERRWARVRYSLMGDAVRMSLLRQRYLHRLLGYVGVPYHKRYHNDQSSPYYWCPLFLDCCGLIRRVLWDLQEDFGFRLGSYNQSYQYDTLCHQRVSSVHELVPGDLIFYSGTYYPEKKAKNHPHNMVHVEVYLGNGRTLGARYQTGVVQVHDSYVFESKSYFDVTHHFCPINSWLAGVCINQCKLHNYAKMSRKKKSPAKSKISVQSHRAHIRDEQENKNIVFF
eukprot:ANDGO_06803.mRNA.1 hypothetical protein PTSG_04199